MISLSSEFCYYYTFFSPDIHGKNCTLFQIRHKQAFLHQVQKYSAESELTKNKLVLIFISHE